jgi:hypothetical protein
MKSQYDIVARIHFYSSEAGGRKGPTATSFFGCPLEFEGEKFDCRLLLEENGPVKPGQTVSVPIAFLYPELVKPRLTAGSRFTLWEMRTIADGIVESVLADRLKGF